MDILVKIPRCAEVRVKCQAGHHCEDTPTGITCAPDPVCPANEVFNICASDCEQTCVPMGRPCTLNCLPPKCQCKDGYVREGGRCIDPKKCPNRKQSTDRIHESVMQSYGSDFYLCFFLKKSLRKATPMKKIRMKKKHGGIVGILIINLLEVNKV
ncbi:trypsin Inhibitor like cysteine rich domain protein [Necator americanus]|uniref:Trypsin Inhibitor like cysteine rich domain protein n=1 Tax=Necator americanus TaxID=51031 RepID=W2TY21_NECAM|nr:trypsin Inhibitor like cysteine rich domain protein [Necator americanus]ETN85917.1 trypsin Inhibitor like cysteine rich domain protein [Necator americanus]